VLNNLIGNALKFCKRGDKVTLRGDVQSGMLCLEVVDGGPGIGADDLPHLFEPYWTTARGRERGTGLGLFITKAIVEAHNGTIEVHSTVGTGTTFRICLPLR
jgi:signal transduction histidine kinase